MLFQDIAYLNADMDIVWHQDIRIRGPYIETIAPAGTLHPQAKEEWQSGEGLLLMPGFCDGHMHTAQQLLKGCVLDAEGMIWKEIMLPFESTLTKERMRLNAQLAALEMLHNGTTSFVDAGGYHMDAAASVYVQSGLRGAISYSTMDADPSLPASIQDTCAQALAHSDALYDRWHGKGQLQVFYSLRTLLSVSEDLIVAVHAHAKERHTSVTAHMNEYAKEVAGIKERCHLPPYELLQRLQVLDEHFIGAHSLLLEECELEVMEKAKSSVVLCPFSNAAKAIAPLPFYRAHNIPLALGSDGAAHGGLSLWNEMRNLRCMMNVTHGILQGDTRILTAKQLLRMAMQQSRLLKNDRLSAIKEGNLADFQLIRLHQPHLYPTGNLVHTLVECGSGSDVDSVMVHGTWLMKHQQVLTLDEKAILQEAEEYQRLQKQF